MDRSLVPPRELSYDGTLSEDAFLTIGENFCTQILVPLARLTRSSALLDLGCGNGSVARPLTEYLAADARYEGLDVNAAGITWLNQHYAAYPNFRFRYADVYNKYYNPNGPVRGAHYRLPFPDATFDVVLLKSVFTHVLPDDLANYFHEIDRVLRPGGRSVITYFLLNEQSRRYMSRGLNVVKFPVELPGDPWCRVGHLEIPEEAVAHDEGRIRELYAGTGMTLQEIVYGNWCGRASILGLQDFIIGLKE